MNSSGIQQPKLLVAWEAALLPFGKIVIEDRLGRCHKRWDVSHQWRQQLNHIYSIKIGELSYRLGVETAYHMSSLLWLNAAFHQLRNMPKFICDTPIKIDIFIFKELVKGSSVLDPCHAGSRPNGYGSDDHFTSPALEAVLHQIPLLYEIHYYLIIISPWTIFYVDG